LINAAFLTPYYDITFSQSVRQKGEHHKYRDKRTVWCDLCQLPKESDDPVIFFGGKDYMPLFGTLTRAYRGRRIIFHNSEAPPAAPGYMLQRYRTTTKMNWHYECAQAFLDGKITVDDAELAPFEEDRIASAGMRSEKAWSDSGSAHAFAPRSASAPKAGDFRNALRVSFEEAEHNGLSHIDVQAGNLHRQVGGYPGANHRMPICCDAMRAIMTPGDRILDAPPSRRGASLTIRYKLPRMR